MKKKVYDDRYAQVRILSRDREVIYFWINNMDKSSFKKRENGAYCLDGEDEYLGVKIKYSIELSPELYEKLPRARIPFPIEFRGGKELKGIGFHIKKNAFPGIVKGKCGDVSVRVEWSGNYRRLSRYNEKAVNMERYQRKLKNAQR